MVAGAGKRLEQRVELTRTVKHLELGTPTVMTVMSSYRTVWFYNTEMHPKDVDVMANCVGTEQTAQHSNLGL